MSDALRVVGRLKIDEAKICGALAPGYLVEANKLFAAAGVRSRKRFFATLRLLVEQGKVKREEGKDSSRVGRGTRRVVKYCLTSDYAEFVEQDRRLAELVAAHPDTVDDLLHFAMGALVVYLGDVERRATKKYRVDERRLTTLALQLDRTVIKWGEDHLEDLKRLRGQLLSLA